MRFEFCIFSYNRGQYLENCLASLHRCLPAQGADTTITIYDDGSDHPETVALLESLSENVHTSDRKNDERLGRLYTNMQTALDRSQADFICFLQDDTQLVRPLDAEDFDYIETYFEKDPKAGFLFPFFLQARSRRNINRRKLTINSKFPGYIMGKGTRNHTVGVYFTDISIIYAARLREINWQFAPTEKENAIKAKSFFSPMMIMAHPFAMFVPETPIYRGGQPNWFDSLAVKIFGRDVKAFRTMTHKEVAHMKNRPLSEHPYAEDFLETADSSVRKPYVYRAVDRNKVIKKLHRMEMKIRGL